MMLWIYPPWGGGLGPGTAKSIQFFPLGAQAVEVLLSLMPLKRSTFHVLPAAGTSAPAGSRARQWHLKEAPG